MPNSKTILAKFAEGAGASRKQAGARKSRLIARLAMLLASGAILAGCSNLRPTQQAFAPDEYDVRHPIKLADTLTHLDVFPTGHGLDRRQHQDVVAFARDFVANGRQGLSAAVPNGHGASTSLAAIRQALAEGGYRGGLQVVPYASEPKRGAAPIRLSFAKLQAKVDSQCGLWPADLAGSVGAESWHNRPYHNLGCSYQTIFAAQVADPIDLVRPRPEGAIDVAKRTKDIEDLRKGTDPATKWTKDDVSASDAKK